MKKLQKKILARIECAKEDLLTHQQIDYKHDGQVSVITAHIKGYVQALEHVNEMLSTEVELEEIRDNIEAERLFELEREGFKHDFPTR